MSNCAYTTRRVSNPRLYASLPSVFGIVVEYQIRGKAGRRCKPKEERQRDEWIENRTMTRNVVPTFIVSHGEWIRRAERDAESAWMDIRTY